MKWETDRRGLRRDGCPKQATAKIPRPICMTHRHEKNSHFGPVDCLMSKAAGAAATCHEANACRSNWIPAVVCMHNYNVAATMALGAAL